MYVGTMSILYSVHLCTKYVMSLEGLLVRQFACSCEIAINVTAKWVSDSIDLRLLGSVVVGAHTIV